MKYLKYTVAIIYVFLMASCNTSEKKKTKFIDSKKMYSFTIDTTGISIIWTAYKFTDKVGVSGTFDDFTFSNKKASGSIENILNKSQLSIATASINSGNTIRDLKLNTYFFEVFNTPIIHTSILNIEDSEGITKVSMNTIAHEIPFTYTLDNDTITVFTHLDLKSWKGEEAMTRLNKECYDLHKGTDGISKLWPDIDVVIKLPVNKTQETE